MSDPLPQRPIEPPPLEAPRKSASALIWILVLIALIAFGWYFYTRNAATITAAPDLDTSPPVAGDAMAPDANAPGTAETPAVNTPPAATGDAMTPGTDATGTAAGADAGTAPPASGDAAAPAAKATPKHASRKPSNGKRSTAKPTVAKASPPRSTEVALLDQPKPSYPPAAYRAREEGTVTVMAHVDASGAVSDATVTHRSGSRLLDRAAVIEVKRWKFRPATRDGKGVPSSIQVPVDYKLSANN